MEPTGDREEAAPLLGSGAERDGLDSACPVVASRGRGKGNGKRDGKDKGKRPKLDKGGAEDRMVLRRRKGEDEQVLRAGDVVTLRRFDDLSGSFQAGPFRVVGCGEGQVGKIGLVSLEPPCKLLRIRPDGCGDVGGILRGPQTRFVASGGSGDAAGAIAEGIREVSLYNVRHKCWLLLTKDRKLLAVSERVSLACCWVSKGGATAGCSTSPQTMAPAFRGVAPSSSCAFEPKLSGGASRSEEASRSVLADELGCVEPRAILCATGGRFDIEAAPEEGGEEGRVELVAENEDEEGNGEVVIADAPSPREFWKAELLGLPALELRRPPLHPMDAYLAGEVRSLSRTVCVPVDRATEGALLAAWAALLCRYTRSEEVAIGVETCSEQTPLIVRVPFSWDWSLSLLVDAVEGKLCAAREHAWHLAQCLLEGHAAPGALPRVGFVHGSRAVLRGPKSSSALLQESLKPPWPSTEGLQGSPLALQLRAAVTLCHDGSAGAGHAQGVGVELQIVYNLGLVTEASARLMLDHLRSLVTSKGRCSDVGMSGPDERELLLRWSDETSKEFEACNSQRVHEAFVDHALARPTITALVDDGRSTTYHQLKTMAANVAGDLCAAGVEVDSLVPLISPRCIEMLVGIYGILMAGAGYLPLDPGWPARRLAEVCAQAAPHAACAGPSCVERLADVAPTIIHLGAAVEAILGGRASPIGTAAPIEPLVAGRSLGGRGVVYCFFTSGSTGKPKGIVVEHRGLVHRVAWFQKEWGIQPGERGIFKHSYTFGLSEWEIFWTLSYGATLVLARDGGEKEVEYLWSLTEQHHVRTQVFVPSVLRAVLEYVALEVQGLDVLWPHLRTVITCGEPLPPSLAQQFFDAVPHADLVNLYGPTEGEMTIWRCPKGEILQAVPIGVPMGGSRVLLRTPSGSLSAIGEPGEVHFGGQFIARGYLGLDGLTAEKFVEDFHEGGRGGRLYATGDLAQWRDTGLLDFIGRADFQVKIRGFRIELGDIEETLRSGGASSAACVVAGEALQQRLVVYCSPVNLDAAALRAQCASRLPAYMVPAQVVLLEALPRTLSGKVDRRALPLPPDPLAAEEGVEAAVVEPRCELEGRIRAVWAEVLSRPAETLSVEADWPLVGGNSLLAGRATSLLRMELQVQLPGTAMYTHSTVARLAELATKSGYEADGQAMVEHGAPDSKDAVAIPGKARYRGLNPLAPSALLMQLLIGVAGCAFGDTGSNSLRCYIAYHIYQWGGRNMLLVLLPSFIVACTVFEAIFCVAAKHLVVGRLRPGRYPLWGRVYFRWLFHRHLVEKTRDRVAEIFSGTPVITIFFRCLGAQIGDSVELNDPEIEEADLVTIGNDTEVHQARFANAAIVDGELVLLRIHVGPRCRILPRAMVTGGTDLRAGSEVAALAGTAGWAGAVGAYCPAGESYIERLFTQTQDTLRLVLGVPAVLLIHSLAAALAVVAIEALHHLCGARRWLFWLLAPALLRHLSALGFFALTVLQKRLVVGRLAPGSLPPEGSWEWQWDHFRSWLHEQAVSARAYDDAADPLVGSELLSVMYRLLGMTVGRRVQIDTFFCSDPDCVTIDDDVVFGSAVSVWCQGSNGRGAVRFHRGCNVLDHCCVLAGARVGERAVLGSATLAPEGSYFPPESISTGQVGGKPVRLRFQSSQEEALANEREALRRLNSDFWFWGFNALLVGAAAVCAPVPQWVGVATYLLHTSMGSSLGWVAALALLPLNFFAVNLLVLCLNWALKWILVGRYMEGDYTFFSRYHIIWMVMLMLAGVMEDALDALAGTELKAWYYRAMGAQVGHSCCLFGLAFEYDLLSVGDCSSVGWECDTTCHTVENMVIKLVPTHLEAYTSMLSHSMVSPGAVMGEGSIVLENSQVLKGEQVPPDEVWAGLPAACCGAASAAFGLQPGRTPADFLEPARAPIADGGEPQLELQAAGPSGYRAGLVALEDSAAVALLGSVEMPRFLVERILQGSLRLRAISQDGTRLLGYLRIKATGEVDFEGRGGPWCRFAASADPEGDPAKVALRGVCSGFWLRADADDRLAASWVHATVAVQQQFAASQVLVAAADRARRRREDQEHYFEQRRQQAAYAAATGRQQRLKGKGAKSVKGAKGKGSGAADAGAPCAPGLRARKGGKGRGKGGDGAGLAS